LRETRRRPRHLGFALKLPPVIVYGTLALLCLIAGFGLGMYEYELRRRIADAVHRARPDLEPRALFAITRSLRASGVGDLYRERFPKGRLLQRHTAVAIAAPACFLAFVLFLVLAIKHS
jgi:hypothetical protein